MGMVDPWFGEVTGCRSKGMGGGKGGVRVGDSRVGMDLRFRGCELQVVGQRFWGSW